MKKRDIVTQTNDQIARLHDRIIDLEEAFDVAEGRMDKIAARAYAAPPAATEGKDVAALRAELTDMIISKITTIMTDLASSLDGIMLGLIDDKLDEYTKYVQTMTRKDACEINNIVLKSVGELVQKQREEIEELIKKEREACCACVWGAIHQLRDVYDTHIDQDHNHPRPAVEEHTGEKAAPNTGDADAPNTGDADKAYMFKDV